MNNSNWNIEKESKLRQPSLHHNITIYYDKENKLHLRQINNSVSLTDNALSHLKTLMGNYKIVNVTPNNIKALLDGTITREDLVEKVTTFIFISSFGLIDDAEWTSYQPSEGISLLAEWLAKNESSAAPLTIDPNLLCEELFPTIEEHVTASQHVVFAFSIIPANIENDIEMILKVKKAVPNSTIVVGGIGSDALKLLPTADGKKGLQNSLPINLILENDGLVDLANMSRELSGITNKVRNNSPDFYEISESRLIANELFIPYKLPDIIHKVPYSLANAAKRDTVAQILVDNRCIQNCYFCSSPKQQRFQNTEEALNYIEEKSKTAEIIAFNDNDLSYNIEGTIKLCHGMVERNINQPKYGKFGVRQFSPELIDALKLANFKRIAIGVESFDQNVRASLGKKNFTDENIIATLNYLLKKKIQPEINLIIASPSDTYDSLKTTVTQGLDWARKGCLLFTTIGLSAVANSPAVMQLMKKDNFAHTDKIEFKEIFHEGMKSTLLLPKYWKSSKEMIQLRETLIKIRTDVLFELHDYFKTKMPVPVRNYVIVTLVAYLLGIEGFKTKSDIMPSIYEYAERHYSIPYINI